jgi:hypothetical protein
MSYERFANRKMPSWNRGVRENEVVAAEYPWGHAIITVS